MGHTRKEPCERCGEPCNPNKWGLCKPCRTRTCAQCQGQYYLTTTKDKLCSKCRWRHRNRPGTTVEWNGVAV